jgi:hypothetical protein
MIRVVTVRKREDAATGYARGLRIRNALKEWRPRQDSNLCTRLR